MTETLPAVRDDTTPAIQELSIADLIRQVTTIQHAMTAVMKDGEHYGVIPGTGTKPTLLKGGAEKLALLFRLDPEYESIEKYDGAHLTVKSKCSLYHIPTGDRIASGEGLCTTLESKYRYRNARAACPKCGAEALAKNKDGKTYQCIGGRGGCWEKFPVDDPRMASGGKVENPDPADLYNTVLKMANKRALIAAVLNATAASDIFTQDLEDFTNLGGVADPAPEQSSAPPETLPAKEKFVPKRGATKPVKTPPAPEPEKTEVVDAEPEEEKIGADERKKLFALGRDAGLSETDLREVVRAVSGQDSTSELTVAQYEQIVADLGPTPVAS